MPIPVDDKILEVIRIIIWMKDFNSIFIIAIIRNLGADGPW